MKAAPPSTPRQVWLRLAVSLVALAAAAGAWVIILLLLRETV
jgi:hypothetical protein